MASSRTSSNDGIHHASAGAAKTRTGYLKYLELVIGPRIIAIAPKPERRLRIKEAGDNAIARPFFASYFRAAVEKFSVLDYNFTLRVSLMRSAGLPATMSSVADVPLQAAPLVFRFQQSCRVEG